MSRGNGILTPKIVRSANSAVILQLLRQHRSMSRADLARRSGLTEGSVSRVTSGLIKRRLVSEGGAESSTGGRPGRRLCLDEWHLGIGVEIRSSNIRMAALTMAGRIVDSLDDQMPSTPDKCFAAVVRGIRKFQTNFGKSRIYGIGVSVGGIVNSKMGIVECGNLPSWVGIPIVETLGAATNARIHVDNDVRLAAIAEYHYGSLHEVRNSRSLLFVLVDEGLGTGIVLDGTLYSGTGFGAGEFGQMVIADNGGDVRRNREGCLENLASIKALCQRYAALTDKRAFSSSKDLHASVRKLCQLALGGDKVAIQAFAETCRYLGIGLANMAWGLNPDAVVIDSPMNEAWQLVVTTIRSQFPTEKEIVNFRHLTMLPSSLGGEATITGAGTLAFQNLFACGEEAEVVSKPKARK